MNAEKNDVAVVLVPAISRTHAGWDRRVGCSSEFAAHPTVSLGEGR